MWIIQRLDGSGGFYAGSGRDKTWTHNRASAQRFPTREAALIECCSNETPVLL